MMKYIFSVLAVAMVLMTGSAQKFGYINTAELLESMPEVDTADKLLAAFQEGLVKGGQSKVTSFEANYKKYIDEMNQGVLSKVQQSEREAALTREQEAIKEYEQQVQIQVMQKREELLKPILQKVDEAIQAEGTEGEYLFIFDSSASGALLFARESDNLLAAVKRRLGIQ